MFWRLLISDMSTSKVGVCLEHGLANGWDGVSMDSDVLKTRVSEVSL